MGRVSGEVVCYPRPPQVPAGADPTPQPCDRKLRSAAEAAASRRRDTRKAAASTHAAQMARLIGQVGTEPAGTSRAALARAGRPAGGTMQGGRRQRCGPVIRGGARRPPARGAGRV